MKANAPKRKIFNDAVDMITGVDVPVIVKDIQMLPVDAVKPFHDHPFRLYEGERLKDMVESVHEHGILNPVIVLQTADGYEMLSGHNRQNAAKAAGLKEIPAIVKKGLTEEEAYIYVIETNMLQRSFSELLPSEKAAVMAEHYEKVCGNLKREEIVQELEALSGKTSSDAGGHNGHQVKSRDIVAKEYGFSSRNAARYLRINYLIKPFKELMDDGNLALLSAMDISYLTEDEQQVVYDIIEQTGTKLRPKTATALRKASGNLTADAAADIMQTTAGKKKTATVNLRIPSELYSKYMDGMKPEQMVTLIERALAAWVKSGKEAANV